MSEPTPESQVAGALWTVCPACFAVVAGIERHEAAAHPTPTEPAPEPDPAPEEP